MKTAPVPITAALAILFAATLAPKAHALDIKRMTLSNGAVLLVSEQRQLPMVTMSIAFDAGSRRDPKGKEGLSALTASSLTLGTKKLTAAEFNQKTDFMGSAVSIGASRDYATASMTTLKKYEDDTLRLLADALADPGLRPAEIERKRAEIVAGIKAQEEEPGYAAGVAFTRLLYGPDSPYGHLSEGTAESVGKLTPDDVRGFYREYYKIGSAAIAVAGDVSADEIKSKLEKEFASLHGTVPPQPEPPAPVVPPGLHPDLIDRNVSQANVIIGFGGIARSNPDYYRVLVMNYMVGGGGFASRLTKVVRSEKGLAYSIGAGMSAGKFPGAYEAMLQTKNQSAQEAIGLVLQVLREMQEKPVSDAELDGAKKFLIGSFPLKIDKLSSLTSFMLQIELYGLGLDYADRYPKLIGEVTRDDVLAVAKKYLHPDGAVVVAVANQNEAKIDVAKLTSH